MNSFEFDTYTNPKTRLATVELVNIDIERKKSEIESQLRQALVIENFWYNVQSYLVEAKMLTVDPYNHEFGFRYKKQSHTIEVTNCSRTKEHDCDHSAALVSVAIKDHPKLEAIFDEDRRVRADYQAFYTGVEDGLQSRHREQWAIIENHLLEKGLIKKDPSTESGFNGLTLSGRMVHFMGDSSESPKMLLTNLMNQMKKLVK